MIQRNLHKIDNNEMQPQLLDVLCCFLYSNNTKKALTNDHSRPDPVYDATEHNLSNAVK